MLQSYWNEKFKIHLNLNEGHCVVYVSTDLARTSKGSSAWLSMPFPQVPVKVQVHD
jgi:hypothetical protein